MLRRGVGTGAGADRARRGRRSDEPCRSADRRHRPATSAAARRRDGCPGRRSGACPGAADAGCRRDAASAAVSIRWSPRCAGSWPSRPRATSIAPIAPRSPPSMRARRAADLGDERPGSRPRRAMPWPRSPRPTTGGWSPAPSSCRKLAQGEAAPADARRRRDQARPRRPQVCAPCPRRPHRSRAAQQASRPEARPARAQGGARGDGRRPRRPAPTCAISIPSTCSSSACARRCSRRAAASQPGLPSRRGRKRRRGCPTGRP